MWACLLSGIGWRREPWLRLLIDRRRAWLERPGHERIVLDGRRPRETAQGADEGEDIV